MVRVTGRGGHGMLCEARLPSLPPYFVVVTCLFLSLSLSLSLSLFLSLDSPLTLLETPGRTDLAHTKTHDSVVSIY